MGHHRFAGFVLLAAVALLFARPARAGDSEAARRMLRDVDAAYRASRGYHLDIAIERKLVALGSSQRSFAQTSRIECWARRPGRVRSHLSVDPMMGLPGEDIVMTDDGTRTLLVRASEYILREGSRVTAAAMPYDMPLFFAESLGPGHIAAHAGKLEMKEKKGRPETEDVTINGMPVACVVVKVDDPSSLFPEESEVNWMDLRLWVDPEGHRILRYEGLGEHIVDSPFGGTTTATVRFSCEYRVFEMTGEDGTPDEGEGRFRILVPEGARRVERFTPPAGLPAPADLDMLGREASPFTLPVLASGEPREIGLKSLSRQTVVLAFVASWCGPSKAELEGLRAMGVPGDVRILAISSEQPEAASTLVAGGGAILPVLHDAGGRVAVLYEVDFMPTLIVIGPDRKIAARFRGVTGEEALREAIERAAR